MGTTPAPQRKKTEQIGITILKDWNQTFDQSVASAHRMGGRLLRTSDFGLLTQEQESKLKAQAKAGGTLCLGDAQPLGDPETVQLKETLTRVFGVEPDVAAGTLPLALEYQVGTGRVSIGAIDRPIFRAKLAVVVHELQAEGSAANLLKPSERHTVLASLVRSDLPPIIAALEPSTKPEIVEKLRDLFRAASE